MKSEVINSFFQPETEILTPEDIIAQLNHPQKTAKQAAELAYLAMYHDLSIATKIRSEKEAQDFLKSYPDTPEYPPFLWLDNTFLDNRKILEILIPLQRSKVQFLLQLSLTGNENEQNKAYYVFRITGLFPNLAIVDNGQKTYPLVNKPFNNLGNLYHFAAVHHIKTDPEIIIKGKYTDPGIILDGETHPISFAGNLLSLRQNDWQGSYIPFQQAVLTTAQD